jgi:hypothetical protein
LFSWGGRIVVCFLQVLFDHPKKTNNYSTTPRNQTTIRPPQENKQLFDHPKKSNNYSFDFLGWSNSCLISWGGRIVVCFLQVVEKLFDFLWWSNSCLFSSGGPQENKQLFDHPKKTNNYSTTPRNQTTIRSPEENKQLFDHHKKSVVE